LILGSHYLSNRAFSINANNYLIKPFHEWSVDNVCHFLQHNVNPKVSQEILDTFRIQKIEWAQIKIYYSTRIE